MKHLREMIHFLCFQFCKVVQKQVRWKNIASLIACFLSNISTKYYENPKMLSRVIATNIGDGFIETQCISIEN